MAEGSGFRSEIRLPDGWDVRAYMGDVSTPTGLVVRSGGGERAYMGDVSTPARGNLADNHYKCCKKILQIMMCFDFSVPLEQGWF